MEEFNTLEKVQNLFKSVNCISENNNYFIAYKDLTKNTGMVGGMDYPYEGLLVNFTENGLGVFMLKQPGIILTNPKLSKMNLDKESYFFINNDDIESVNIKNFALLNSKKKKISLKTKDGKTHYLYACVNEDIIPYHNEGFAKFMEKYSK